MEEFFKTKEANQRFPVQATGKWCFGTASQRRAGNCTRDEGKAGNFSLCGGSEAEKLSAVILKPSYPLDHPENFRNMILDVLLGTVI